MSREKQDWLTKWQWAKENHESFQQQEALENRATNNLEDNNEAQKVAKRMNTLSLLYRKQEKMLSKLVSDEDVM